MRHLTKRSWFMIVLCALPFLGIALWFFMGKNIGNLATFGLILACPLSHIFLMNHTKGGDHHGKTESLS